MATTTPPRKLRLLWNKGPSSPIAGMTLEMGLGGRALKWVLKREVGAGFGRWRSFVTVGAIVGLKIMVLEEEERGEDLRTCKPIFCLVKKMVIEDWTSSTAIEYAPCYFGAFSFFFNIYKILLQRVNTLTTKLHYYNQTNYN